MRGILRSYVVDWDMNEIVFTQRDRLTLEPPASDLHRVTIIRQTPGTTTVVGADKMVELAVGAGQAASAIFQAMPNPDSVAESDRFVWRLVSYTPSWAGP